MRALALTLETIAGQSSTDGKVQAAAAFLASQPPSRVAAAARFLAGAPLPPGSPATRVGRSTLVDLVSAFTGAARKDLIQRATLLGDLGLAVAEVLEGTSLRPTPRLTIEAVATALAGLGNLGGEARARRLRELLARSTPLEAKYLTKLLLGSLRTGMQAGRVEEAVALAFDAPLSLVRRAHMLLGDIGATAERAGSGGLETVSLRAFRPVRMMLAHPAANEAQVAAILPAPMIAEHKYDGIRAQLHLADAELRLYSRALEDFTHMFPEIRGSAPPLLGEWILDGEIVAWLDGRTLSFATLQRRLGRNQVPLTLLLDAPVVFLAFDALRAASEDLIDAPLSRRKEALGELPAEGGVRRAPWTTLRGGTEIAAWFARAVGAGEEGAVFKDPESRYRPGMRGRAWVKLKRPTATLDVVVTGAEYGRGKRAGMLSDLIFAVRGPDGLLDTGRAYSGLSDREIVELTGVLKRTTVETAGTIRRVEPSVVLEVTFDDVQPSTRHASGFALRFPRIVRRRIDLGPEQASTLEDLRRLHAGEA